MSITTSNIIGLPANINELPPAEQVTIVYDYAKHNKAIICEIDTCRTTVDTKHSFFSFDFNIAGPRSIKDTQQFVNDCMKIAIRSSKNMLLIQSNFWGYQYATLYINQ